jgi:hypothetical protein
MIIIIIEASDINLPLTCISCRRTCRTGCVSIVETVIQSVNRRQKRSELWTVNLAEIFNLLIGTETWGQLAVVRQHIKTLAESCIKCSVNSVRGHHQEALTWLYCASLWCNIISTCVREFPSLPFYLLTSWLQCSFSDKVIITLSRYNWFKTSFAQERRCRYASDCCMSFPWRVAQSRPNAMMKAQLVRERSVFSLSYTSFVLTRSIIFSQGKGSKLAVDGVILE